MHYALHGTPGDLAILIPSTSSGPLPLAVVFPGDPRELEVGLDLVGLLWAGPLDPTGEAEVRYPIPPVPALSGFGLYAQALTVVPDFSAALDVSNPTRFVLSLKAESQLALGELTFPREMATATTLADGRVLIAGGVNLENPTLTLDSFEIFDPTIQDFVAEGPIGGGRAMHTGTLLPDGRVLLAGGLGDGSAPLATGVVLDPCTGTVSPVPGTMSTARVFHTATAVPDGRVVVLGGSSDFTPGDVAGLPASVWGGLATAADVYDPVSNAWSAPADLPRGVTMHGASLLGDGRILLSGGVLAAVGPAPPKTTDEVWFYEPSEDKFVAAPVLPAPRALHGFSSTATGGAMVFGGGFLDPATRKVSPYLDSIRFEDLGPADTPTWQMDQAVPVPALRGSVLCLEQPQGGYDYIVIPCPQFTTTPPAPLAPLEILGSPVKGGAWKLVGGTMTFRGHSEVALLDDIRTLIPGAGGPLDTSVEVFAIP